MAIRPQSKRASLKIGRALCFLGKNPDVLMFYILFYYSDIFLLDTNLAGTIKGINSESLGGKIGRRNFGILKRIRKCKEKF